MTNDEVYYIELEGRPASIRLWEYYNSTDNDKCSVYGEWRHLSTKHLHFYYHKPLLF